ncbi:MAG: hypothetical protein JSV29_06255 [Candidatus Bathyarchaeota archaeon]|nr:MAG: hypothetical protein JSV29_06255 [Candidatus Bathyarchaeota archaeon]
MRTVIFDPEKLTDPDQKEWWQQWEDDAKAATVQVIKSWEEWLATDPRPSEFDCPFQQAIWKRLKAWLLENVFNFKCAYCESPLDLDRYYGDAEHFRPKGRVTFNDSDGKKTMARCILPDGTSIAHPGYFWLAYNWRNLVPACSFCNTGEGKVDQFPTNKGYLLMKRLSAQEKATLEETLKEETVGIRNQEDWYLLGPRALDAEEEPLLLNPLNPNPQRKPRKHLHYGLGGTVVAVDNSSLGENSIKAFNLRRDKLNKRRQKAQESVRRLYYGVFLAYESETEVQERLVNALKPFRDGSEDYSSAALDYVRELERIQKASTKAAVGDDD